MKFLGQISKLLLVIFIKCNILSSAVASDTLIIKPNDEFLKIRVQKFSDDDALRTYIDPHRVLVLKDGAPFTGTIIKLRGVSHFGSILGSGAQYLDEPEDETYFKINYKNGVFHGEYAYESPEVNIKLQFSEGIPVGLGELVYNKPLQFSRQFVPDLFPTAYVTSRVFAEGFIPILERGENLGIYDFKTRNHIKIIPEGIDLANLIKTYILRDQYHSNCGTTGTLTLQFNSGKLISTNVHTTCGYSVTFSTTAFLGELPFHTFLFDASESYEQLNYNVLVFDPFDQPLNLCGGWTYYYQKLINETDLYFLSSLAQFPEKVTVSSTGFVLEMTFDINRIKKTAKPVLYGDIISNEPPFIPKSLPLFYIDHVHIKSFSLEYINDDITINTNYNTSENLFVLSSKFNQNQNPGSFKLSGNSLTGNIDSLLFRKEYPHEYNYVPESLSIVRQLNGEYIITSSGNLAYTPNDQKIINAQMHAFRNPENKYLFELIPHGESWFRFTDGSIKKYKFINGDVVID